MEIFNTIGQLLTTPNAEVASTICNPLVILETFISMLLFTTVLNIKTTSKQKFIYVFISSMLGIINRVVIPNPYRNFFKCNCVTNFSIFHFQNQLIKKYYFTGNTFYIYCDTRSISI